MNAAFGISHSLARVALTPTERQRLLAARVIEIPPPAPPRRGRYVSRGFNRTDGLTTQTAREWLQGKFHPSLTLADIARQKGLHAESLRARISAIRNAPKPSRNAA